jgi:hypothetical protein
MFRDFDIVVNTKNGNEDRYWLDRRVGTLLLPAHEWASGHGAGYRHRLDQQAEPKYFVWIGRSSIGNLNQIREIYREGPFNGCLVLANVVMLRMSKVGRQKLNKSGRIPS